MITYKQNKAFTVWIHFLWWEVRHNSAACYPVIGCCKFPYYGSMDWYYEDAAKGKFIH